ncbi:ricin-type beta-trefoil lectin domain protein [Actinospica durhamensis]|uniref:Ricin-type beta-trefoil lectin domain protein n=2 Tax=Actinospica durhamensis TaxID=1508375 RepID=A0A941IR38_9ACTN|nr:ricin-type beta-trefoil lectin domain protein [Actinospica durhamensis]
MYVAPYVDMSNSQESVLNTVISSDKLQAYTAAFAIGEGCSDIWGDTLPIGSDPTIGGEISSAKAAGAQVIVSSGGSAGEPLSFTCGTQSTIDAGYQAIINDYGTDYLDFDIEGAAIADTTGIDQTFQAMKDLKASNPSLVWSVTVPVLPTGLDNYGTALLQDAKNEGVTIPVVNIMTMDYYEGDLEMGQAAISAAEATLSQMKAVNSSYTYANVGITPMIGVNDDGSTFTLSDASTVASWAASNGIGRLAFWSVDRDQACPGGATGGSASSTCSGVSQGTGAFTAGFLSSGGGGSSGGGSGGGTGATGAVTGYQGLCLDVRSASTADGTAVQVYTCNGTNAQQWTVESNGTLQALGKCLDVTGAGTANGTKVQLYTCNGTGAQQWKAQSNGELVNTNSGSCLDDTGYGGSGTQVQIWACADTSNQQWHLP